MESATEKTTEKRSVSVNLLVICTTIVFILLAVLELFVPAVELKGEYLCYAVGAIVVIAGIAQIVRYFVTDAYRNMNEYGFSLGTLGVIIGICILLKAGALSVILDTVLGLAVLLMGVMILQHSLDLNRMRYKIWIVAVILAILVILCGVAMILRPLEDRVAYETFTWWAVLVSACLGFITNISTMIMVAVFKRNEAKQAESGTSGSASSETDAAYAGDAETDTAKTYGTGTDTVYDAVSEITDDAAHGSADEKTSGASDDAAADYVSSISADASDSSDNAAPDSMTADDVSADNTED